MWRLVFYAHTPQVMVELKNRMGFMYQALYRKWRPLIFSDVVGQAHVTDTLRAQVTAGRLSHAYLFTGTRGTGKTSCAKILARAANCLSPVAGNPCNQCAPCLGVLDGSLLDVVEIDAASNSGVDNIRALRDETAYTPVSARRRVYIIDEVHMLSIGAFNALLKTLEEPPSYVMFILATTETHKVPATILSRCQRFAFRRLSTKDVADRLLFVAQGEQFTLTEPAALLLARIADGALRDGLSLLDQCAAATPRREGVLTIEEADVYQAIGLAGNREIQAWTEAIATMDTAETLRIFMRLVDAGRDIASLLGELSQALRDTLLAQIQQSPMVDGMVALRNLSSDRLLQMVSIVQATLSTMSHTPQPRIEAELCLLRLCQPYTDLETRLAALEARFAGTPFVAAAVTPHKPDVSKLPPTTVPVAPPVESAPTTVMPKTAQAPLSAGAMPSPPKATPPNVVPSPNVVAVAAAPPPAPTKGGYDWAIIKAQAAAQLPPSLRGFLESEHISLRPSEGLWQVVVTDHLSFQRLNTKQVLSVLETVAGQVVGHPTAVRLVQQSPHEQAMTPQLRMVLDLFPKEEES